MSSALDKLKSYQKIRSQTVICPIIKQTATMSPLTIGDDLYIRTILTTPEEYDIALSKMLFDHIQFKDVDNLQYNDFIQNISHFDRKYLLWGLFATTYVKINDVELTCPSCKEKYTTTIKADDLIQDDSIVVWDKDVPFRQFVHPVDYELNENVSIRFNLSIPSIKKHLDTLQTISSEKLKANFEKFNSILSLTDELLLITSSAELIEKKEITKSDEEGNETVETVEESSPIKSAMELRALFNSYVPIDAEKQLVNKYNEFFEKYEPKFVNKCTCPSCEHHFDFEVDIETSLFKRFIS